MFPRHLLPVLQERARRQPVVTLTGPRQSGKTTLCRQAFPDRPYVNLERPDTREFARVDPRAFLDGLGEGAIIDEIQRLPELLSWIQVEVDARPAPGRYILTGSHQFELSRHIAQSLAGRTALLRLLPLSIAELQAAGPLATDDLLHRGGYPRIHADGLDPAAALADYFETYVQRDLRELVQLRHLAEFERFVRLAAGRVGQILNLQSLAADAGVSGHTARDWITLLEASFIVFRLPPWFANIGKRLVKSPKLYFYDVGLAAWLVGIRQPDHVAAHPLRGLLFENLAVLEVLKTYLNAGERPDLHFFRDSVGNEADLVLEHGTALILVEIKSARSVAPDAMRAAAAVMRGMGGRATWSALVFDGDEAQRRSDFDLVPCRELGRWLRGA
ncbi:MAG: ATP-binding protein [Rhodocyclaceae bacterium]|nr:ATP-binding protein [Rhodocyclaceae bacterium]